MRNGSTHLAPKRAKHVVRVLRCSLDFSETDVRNIKPPGSARVVRFVEKSPIVRTLELGLKAEHKVSDWRAIARLMNGYSGMQSPSIIQAMGQTKLTAPFGEGAAGWCSEWWW